HDHLPISPDPHRIRVDQPARAVPEEGGHLDPTPSGPCLHTTSLWPPAGLSWSDCPSPRVGSPGLPPAGGPSPAGPQGGPPPPAAARPGCPDPGSGPGQ